MRLASLAVCLSVCACSGAPTVGDAPNLPDSEAFAKRPTMSRAECNIKGGQEVGDIGDGRIHRRDYLCANGEPPLAAIVSTGDAPHAVDGAVCCQVSAQ